MLKNRILKNTFSRFILVLIGLTLFSCDYFRQTDDRKVVVRVNESYLYEEDINALINENTSPEDSAIIVSNYITRWATQQLLIDRAELNLPDTQQKEFDELVKNYRNELYTNAYTDAVVTRDLDTSLNREEILVYYEQNKENFILGEDLVKLRYINLARNSNNLDEVKTKFKRFNQEDQEDLLNMAIQFKNYSMNDSVWVKTKTVYDKIGPLSVEDRSSLLKKSNFMELQDSLNVYLVYVNDVLSRNEQAPIEYASATIREILLNKRKQALIKELEKDITKDAIKNNEFEIFD
ncbi:peptidyl-prolyl cis-trans isomerase [Christiangramia sabulilitoris]|uniref:Peptidyl-prolyl cis-trans isomerase n=1 Tax=Christiangramia sabulilitoris TaxID=2583991 RepID=A0A550I381_9FLAO|nr:peptidyl-prolyl cis-trans isomerase [Christiangramia sabulilitoris]TRO65442.1 peptidyl-prolyl cis-trans isomerase [Christiangramia sabulilitoris]